MMTCERMRLIALALSVGTGWALTPSPADAAVQVISSATLVGGADTTVPPDGDADEPATITAFTSGSTNYVVQQGAESVTIGSGTRYWTPGDDPGTDEAALTGTVVTDGVLNTPNGTKFFFSRDVTASDVLFLIDIQDNGDVALGDDPVLLPIDAAGNPIGTFSVTLDPPSPNPSLLEADFDRETGAQLNSYSVLGISWTLADFTGTGTLTGVRGVQLQTNDGIDISTVGLAVIPEPGSLALLGLGVMLMASRKRTR